MLDFEFSKFKQSKISTEAGFSDHFSNFLDDALTSVDYSIKNKKSVIKSNVTLLSNLRQSEQENDYIKSLNNEVER